MKTIAEILNEAKPGDSLTDGVRIWYVEDNKYEGKIAVPVSKSGKTYPKKGFELWSDCELERVAVIPNLRIVKKVKKNVKG